MALLRNPARERLMKGDVAAGINIRQARTVDIAMAMRTAGFDWLFLDLEHNSMSLDTAVQISVAANTAGITPLVRVPRGQYHMATRALDGGAYGIVFPHVDTAEEARECVDRVKYPPLGHRSAVGLVAQLEFAPTSMAEATAGVNANLLTTVMLESPASIANADAIAAVPGVDVLLVGTNDLTIELGVSGQYFHPEMIKAFETVIAACQRHGKWAGMGGLYNEEGYRRYVGMGVRMVLAGSDLGYLMAAAGASIKALRSI